MANIPTVRDIRPTSCIHKIIIEEDILRQVFVITHCKWMYHVRETDPYVEYSEKIVRLSDQLSLDWDMTSELSKMHRSIY